MEIFCTISLLRNALGTKTLQEILSDREATAQVVWPEFVDSICQKQKLWICADSSKIFLQRKTLEFQEILQHLDAATDEWGIRVERVEVRWLIHSCLIVQLDLDLDLAQLGQGLG